MREKLFSQFKVQSRLRKKTHTLNIDRNIDSLYRNPYFISESAMQVSSRALLLKKKYD